MRATTRRTITLALVLFVSQARLSAASVPDGELDGAFGTGGVVTAAIGSAPGGLGGAAIARQPDGQVVVAGGASTSSNSQFALVRYTASGALDTSFGNGGRVVTAIWTYAAARAVAVQPDGRIVAAGSVGNGVETDIALARYNADGSLDVSFGVGGTVTTAVGTGDDDAYALVIQPDGKLVVAGISEGDFRDIVVLRYEADGALDPTFGNNGIVVTEISPPSSETAYALVVQPDGKLVIAGSWAGWLASNSDLLFVRYNSNGSLDSSFGSGGKATVAVSATENDGAYALVQQPDGKLVAAGNVGPSGSGDCALVRVNANGTPDPTFGTGGKVITAFGANLDRATALALQPDGKLVAGGFMLNSDHDFIIARYQPNGSLDASFGSGGKIIKSVAGSDHLSGLALDPVTGSITAVGTVVGVPSKIAILRYLSSGTLDSSFGLNGQLLTSVTLVDDSTFAIARQSDGKLVTAGEANTGTKDDFALARFNVDGTIDTTFGGTGKSRPLGGLVTAASPI